MSAAAHFLASVTLRTWLARDDGLLDTVRDALLDVLPSSFTPGFTTGMTEGALPFVLHQPSSLGFFVVLGARCQFGLSEEECAAFGRAGDDEYWEAARPVLPLVEVDVAPFLLCERVLTPAWVERLGLPPAAGGEGASAALARLGLRLPSEAELCLAWRLACLGVEEARAHHLWEGIGLELAAAPAGQAPRWVNWSSSPFSEARWPERLMVSAPEKLGFRVRPAMSLVPEGVAWGDAGVAARALEPALAWPP